MNSPIIASPFHAKGTLYIGTKTYFDACHDGGWDTFLDSVEDESLREFLSQNFLASSWYDVMVVPALIREESRARGLTLTRYLEERTRWQAERDIHGVYRSLLKLTNPQMVAKRLPRLITQMFDFGQTHVEVRDNHSVNASYSGIPAALETWLANALVVYATTAMTFAGASNVRLRREPTVPTEDMLGIHTVMMSLVMQWD